MRTIEYLDLDQVIYDYVNRLLVYTTKELDALNECRGERNTYYTVFKDDAHFKHWLKYGEETPPSEFRKKLIIEVLKALLMPYEDLPLIINEPMIDIYIKWRFKIGG